MSGKSVLIVASAGGHLQEALLATKGIDMDRVIATFSLPHLREESRAEPVYFLLDPHTSFWKYGINALQSLWLMLRVRPRVVLTTGAGIAIACALWGKLTGAKLVFVETAAAVDRLSRTGALLYRFSDLFIVQWTALCRRYPKAIYGGCLI